MMGKREIAVLFISSICLEFLPNSGNSSYHLAY